MVRACRHPGGLWWCKRWRHGLRRVVELYHTGGDGLVHEMRPLELSADEITDLVSLLEALRSNIARVP